MNRHVAIGVDVGGTKIAAAAVDVRSGDVLMRDEIPTRREEGGARVLERLHGLVSDVHDWLADRNIQSLGVGIGIPELVNNEGEIKSDWNFDWNRRDVKGRLADFGAVILESDARTAALAESLFGHGRDYPSFVFITIGTGLSCAFWRDGHIHRGANGYAIHFGSNDMMAVCSACGEQGAFNLEAFASGRGLSETLRKRTGQTLDAQSLVDAASNDAAKLLLDQASTALASYIGQLVNILDPHAVVIGGGLGLAPSVFDELERKSRIYIWAKDCRSTPIVKSAIHKDSAMIGAAAAFRDSHVDDQDHDPAYGHDPEA
ncbi:MAG: ROK family protein [Alphaproteobacteria bacterium]|nr:ROK family protein [Alphaproteobacteria bacterium]